MTSTSPPELSIVESLALSRLLVASEKGEAARKIKADLGPLLPPREAGEESDPVDQALADLQTAGLVEAVSTSARGKGKAKSKAEPKLVLTSDGRRRALDFLGVRELPAKPKPSWKALCKTYLPARALGLPGDAAIT